MLIKIVSIGPKEYAQGPKAKYSFFVLTYKSGTDLREKKIMSFSKEIFEPLFTSKPGDEFEVEVEKKGEFYNWNSVSKATGKSDSNVPARSRGSSENDQAKVLSIVRQAAVKAAATALGGTKGITPEQVISFASVLVQWCLDQPKLEEEQTPELPGLDDDEEVE